MTPTNTIIQTLKKLGIFSKIVRPLTLTIHNQREHDQNDITPLDKERTLIRDLLKLQPTLNHLSFHNSKREHGFLLYETLKTNTTITTLSLSGGLFELNSIIQLLQVNSTITKLDIYWNSIDKLGVNSLCESLNKNSTLTKLHLRHNAVDSESIPSVADLLKINTTITELNLANNFIDELDFRTLSESLKMNSTLKILDISDNLMNPSSFSLFGDSLKSNTALTKLNCSGIFNYGSLVFTPEVNSFSKLMDSTPFLTILNLGDNKIDDSQISDLANSLKMNSSLTNIYLKRNKITDLGSSILFSALTVNTTLKHLDLKRNLITLQNSTLKSMLKTNSTLQSLDLMYNPISHDDAILLCEWVEASVSILYFGYHIVDIYDKLCEITGLNRCCKMIWEWPETHSKLRIWEKDKFETILLCLKEREYPQDLGSIIIRSFGFVNKKKKPHFFWCHVTL